MAEQVAEQVAEAEEDPALDADEERGYWVGTPAPAAPAAPETRNKAAGLPSRLRAALGVSAMLERQLEADRDNPRLLVAVGHMCMRHRGYQRANVLFGRAIRLGVKTTRVFLARGEALMQMGETSALTRVEEAVPRFITAAEMYQLGLRCGMLDGDARTVSALLCSARAMFRSNQRELCCTIL